MATEGSTPRNIDIERITYSKVRKRLQIRFPYQFVATRRSPHLFVPDGEPSFHSAALLALPPFHSVSVHSPTLLNIKTMRPLRYL